VKQFVTIQEWQLAAINEGIWDAEAGRIVPHEDVVAWILSWWKPYELPMPKCR